MNRQATTRAFLLLACLLPMTFVHGQGRAAAPPSYPTSYAISGTVVHSVTGNPLDKVRVYLLLSGQSNPNPQQVRTAADGRFRFQNLKAGKYQLWAERLGFVRQSYGMRALAQSLMIGVVVGEGQSADGLIFRMKPGAVISGHVTDASGEPVSGLAVQVARLAGVGSQRRVARWPTALLTDDRGYYRFPSLPQGNYLVIVSGRTEQQQVGVRDPDPEPLRYPLTFYPGVTNPESAPTLRLEPGQEVQANVAVSTAPTVHVEGQVAAAAIKQFGNVRLTSRGPFGTEFAFSGWLPVVDSKFSIDAPPGRYSVSLWDGQTMVGRRSVEIAGTRASVSIGETPLPTVSAHVELRGTAPIVSSPIVLRLQQLDALYWNAETLDEDNHVDFKRLPPGLYRVMLSRGRAMAVVSIAATGAVVHGDELEIPEGAEIQLTVVADAGAADVSGFLDREGVAQSGVLVVLVPRAGVENTSSYRIDQSDSDGSFTWHNVSQGDYLMFAVEEGLPEDYLDPAMIGKLLPKGQPLTIGPGRREPVRLEMSADVAKTPNP